MKKVIVLVSLLFLASCTILPKDEIAIKNMGYDVGDVEVFLTSIGSSGTAFLKSSSLRKQYERFRDGEVTPFVAQAKAKADADSARSSEQASGMAAGIAIGMTSS